MKPKIVQKKEVSVIIVNWNSGDLLKVCINHLMSQTILPTRIIIIDNASTDRSENIFTYDDWITVIKSDINLGFAAGNNLALSKCKTDLVALLNPDAFPEPNWLENLIKYSEMYPDAAAFGSCQRCHEDRRYLDGIGDCYHISGLVWRNRHGKMQRPQDKIVREIFSPCAAAALYRRKILQKVGGFDKTFFCYLEDVDLGFRLRLAGHNCIYVPDAVVNHVGSATTGNKHSDFAVYHGHRNIVWTYMKNMPGLFFFFFLPLHLIMNIFTIAIFILRGQSLVILRAKWDAFKGLPKILKMRRELQAKRKANVRKIWIILNKQLIPIIK